MSKIVKFLAHEGKVCVVCCDTTDLVENARKIHDLTPTTTAVLGRVLTIASMMGVTSIKEVGDKITIQINGKGPVGQIVAITNLEEQNKVVVKGYVQCKNVELPLNEIGKIDVGGAVGTDGYLNIIKQMNMSNQNYNGLVPLITGEIAEDFTEYFVKSEQKPTALALGVLVNKDGVKTSGGYVINLMPDATPDVIDKVEKALENSSGISRMLDFGLSLEEIAKRVTGDENVVLIEDNIEAYYKCDCSKDKIERGIISLGENEIKDIIETDEKANIKCQFCNKEYDFSREDLENILKKIKE